MATGRHKFPADDPLTLEMIGLYKQGYSPEAIGKRLHMSRNGVRYRLVNAGVKLDHTRRLPDKTVELIRGLYSQGWSKSKIARELGVCVMTVRKYCKGG